MFENILNQAEVVGRLRQDVEGRTLPPALLFSGPPYSGKLSTALELARVLSCEKGMAEWNCACKSCETHRLLLSTNLVLLGGRYFTAEVAACCDTLSRTANVSGRYLFVRSIRKLTRRFDAFLWDGEESKLARISPYLSRLDELAFDLGPNGSALPPPQELNKRLEEVVALVRKVEDSISVMSVPVSMIRRVAAWAHLKGTEPTKVIILENADRLLDAARNALLKLLEEPPTSVYLILTTSRKNAIIPTILSRVRTYTFQQRVGPSALEVLERIFKVTSSECPDLDSFFLLFQGVKPSTLRGYVMKFLKGAWGGERDLLIEIATELFQDKEKFRLFLQELVMVLEEILRKETVPEVSYIPSLSQMEQWIDLIRKSVESLEVLNVHPLLLGERLFLRMGRDHA
ncbi:MAG: hypothetical protein N2442_10905 [Spirochaetes bacterium]|nr:hypothetical protein [Spirochaetota bacterium]